MDVELPHAPSADGSNLVAAGMPRIDLLCAGAKRDVAVAS